LITVLSDGITAANAPYNLYFSIATFASGGTSITATSMMGEALAALETILGYLMTGLLAAILVRNTIGN
jgi:hypothetical protein